MQDSIRQDGYIAKHHGSVTSLMFSPTDHKLLASAGVDGKIKLTDIEVGTVKKLWHHSNVEALSVAFSPSGASVAGGFNDWTVVVFDAASGNTLNTFRGHTDSVRALAWSPCSNYLVSGGGDSTLRAWHVCTGADEAGPLTGHRFGITSLSWSPQGKKLLASGSIDKTVRIWDTENWKLALGPLMEHITPVVSVTWSPDGKLVASGGVDTRICIWRIDAEKESDSKLLAKWQEREVMMYEICSFCGQNIQDKSLMNVCPKQKIACNACFTLYKECYFHLVERTEGGSVVSWSPLDERIACGGENVIMFRYCKPHERNRQ